MVRSSISFAVKRNARSGASGFTCPNAESATPSAPSAVTAANVPANRSNLIRGLRGDPVEIGRRSIADRDSDDFGKFVGVALTDRGFDAGIEPRAGLDRDRNFVCRFDFASPVIQ